MEWVLIVAVGVVVLLVFGYFINKREEARKAEERRMRREHLMRKYGDAGIVNDILAGTIRQGMTVEQVIDSWGQPAAIDERVFKTKTSRTFKYGQTGRNQFRERVTIENGVVVGWKQR